MVSYFVQSIFSRSWVGMGEKLNSAHWIWSIVIGSKFRTGQSFKRRRREREREREGEFVC